MLREVRNGTNLTGQELNKMRDNLDNLLSLVPDNEREFIVGTLSNLFNTLPRLPLNPDSTLKNPPLSTHTVRIGNKDESSFLRITYLEKQNALSVVLRSAGAEISFAVDNNQIIFVGEDGEKNILSKDNELSNERIREISEAIFKVVERSGDFAFGLGINNSVEEFVSKVTDGLEPDEKYNKKRDKGSDPDKQDNGSDPDGIRKPPPKNPVQYPGL